MSDPKVTYRGWSGDEGPGEEEQRERRRGNHLYWFALVGLLLAAIGTLTDVLPFVGGGEEAPAGKAGQLELAQVDVRNGPADYAYRGNARDEQTQATAPTVDLTLLNHGPRRVLLTQARLEVIDGAAFPVCATQGGGGPVPVSGTYTIELPPVPLGAERTVVKPLHQQIGPDEVDRVLLRFALPAADPETSTVYALRVRLAASEGPPIDLGRFLIATPDPPSRYGFVLPEDDTILAGPPMDGHLSLAATWCFRKNLAELRRLTRLPGRRSTELEALSAVAPAPGWSAAADPTPPRAAALQLLGDPAAPESEPLLAVFAAEQAGDSAFADELRRRGARGLLEAARRSAARHDWWWLRDQARTALALEPSGEARRLLADAERHLSAMRP